MSVVICRKYLPLVAIALSSLIAGPVLADVSNANRCQGSYNTSSDVRTNSGYLRNPSSSVQTVSCPMNVSSVVATVTPVVEVGSVAATTTCYLRTRSRTGTSGSYSSRNVSGSGNKTMTFPSTSVSSFYSYALDCDVAGGAYLWQYRY